MQFWALLVDSLRESLHRKIFWVMVAITVLVGLAMLSLGFESDRVTFVFGLWEVKLDHFNPLSNPGRSRIASLVVYGLMDFFLGTLGILLMLISTGSMMPDFMEKGGIDIVLAKPLSRARLFLYKYVAGLVFVFLQAAFFVVLSFLIMGFRWKTWVPGYLFSIPLLVLLFSYVYCVSALVAVKTGSAMAAILLSIGAWALFAMPSIILPVFDQFPSLKEHERVYQAIRITSWIPPKTADIPYLAAKWSQAGTSIDIFPKEVLEGADESDAAQFEAARQMEERLLTKSALISIGSSLLFEAVLVLWAMFVFAKRDF